MYICDMSTPVTKSTNNAFSLFNKVQENKGYLSKTEVKRGEREQE